MGSELSYWCQGLYAQKQLMTLTTSCLHSVVHKRCYGMGCMRSAVGVDNQGVLGQWVREFTSAIARDRWVFKVC